MKKIEEYTEKDIALIEFREKLLREGLEGYLDMIIGERESFRLFITDDAGVYSEEKCWAFIEELIKCAHLYSEVENAALYRRDMEALDGYQDIVDETQIKNYREYADDVFGAREDFSKEEKQLLQDFLYVVIRNGEFARWNTDGGAPQLFEDFIKGAREHYKEAGELYAEEAYSDAYRDNYSNLKGIYGTASYITATLTDEPMTDKYTEEERKNYYGYINSQLRKEFEKTGCARPSQFLPDFDLDEEESSDYSPESKEKTYLENLAESFDNKDEFVKRYMRFRAVRYDDKYTQDYAGPLHANELRVGNLLADFENTIRMMVRIFTESKGISLLQDDDAYFTASAILKNSDKRLLKVLKDKQGDR